MKGPYPIVCRAHSGGRLLAEIYQKNGIQLGISHPITMDTMSFAVRRNYAIRRTIEESFEYSAINCRNRYYLENLMSNCIGRFIDKEIEFKSEPFGWKFGETIFTLPVVFSLYPNAKAVHLVRDGRDVMLSRINSRFDSDKFHEKFNRLIVFGDFEVDNYKGQSLSKETIEKFRTELEFIHWNTVVEFGRKLRCYPNQYLEIKYEDLCFQPKDTLERIFDFIKVPLLDSTIHWAKNNASTSRISKWKSLSSDYLNSIIEPGRSNLIKYGYY